MNNPQTTGVELAPVAPPVTPSSPARRGAGQDGRTVTSDAVLGGAASLVTIDTLITQLATIRRSAGLTRQQVADRAGIGRRCVDRTEAGTTIARAESLIWWVDALGYELVLRPKRGAR